MNKIKKSVKNVLWRLLSFHKGILIKAGKLDEISFWEKYLKVGKRHSWMEDLIEPQTRRKQFPELLLPYIEEVRAKKGHVKMLDVGCGPLSPLAWGVEQKLFDLTAIDPLAEEYVSLLNKNKISYPVKPIKCTAEEMLDLFNKESFDIVYSRNALDHAADVKKCIQNIYEVLNKDGIFLLEGFVREGTHLNWIGLHQHDLVPENDGLFCYEKNKKPINVSMGYDCLLKKQTGNLPGDWYSIVLKKKSQIS